MAEQFMVGGIKVSLPFFLGAGVAKHPRQILPYLQSDAQVGAVLSGSYTLNERAGNQGNLVWPADFGSLTEHGFGLNAYGMPNIGLTKAIELFPENPTKPHIVSIAGFKASDYTDMLKLLKGNQHIAGVEINGGCPNTGHLPVSYVLEDLAYLLEEIKKVEFDKPIWLKLSPYMTSCQLGWFAEDYPHLNFANTPTVSDWFIDDLCDLLITHARTIQAIVMTNTIPNVTYDDAIIVKNDDGTVQHHKGGLSGSILRHHNLMLIDQMVATGITANIDIIGCGGVMTGDDALAYLEKGCVAVACTSGPNWYGNPKFFSDLLQESDELLNFLSN